LIPSDSESPAVASYLSRASIIIPTFNAASYWSDLHCSLERQGVAREQVLVIDSTSQDNTRKLVEDAGYQLLQISPRSFRHGATRQMAAEMMPQAEFLVYLTQDAIPIGTQSIENLLRPFADSAVGATYGRQVPRNGSDPIERHARLFNYPNRSEIRDFACRHRLGIRAAFFSNSFAAYRSTAFRQVGGFSRNSIVSEEVSVVGQMLMAGWKIAYEAEAQVYHSHRLSLKQEFSRYFDIGVHHHRERHIMDCFGRAEGEGLAFVKSELRFLWKVQPSRIPVAMLRNFNKWIGYRLGRKEASLPMAFKRAVSAQPNFWVDNAQLIPKSQLVR